MLVLHLYLVTVLGVGVTRSSIVSVEVEVVVKTTVVIKVPLLVKVIVWVIVVGGMGQLVRVLKFVIVKVPESLSKDVEVFVVELWIVSLSVIVTVVERIDLEVMVVERTVDIVVVLTISDTVVTV